jgi:soluble lytic murein transglycosylase-like protein
VGQAAGDTSSQARALITAYAQQYGLDSSLPLAIGAQESGFQQTAVSGAGAIGVMQVLPNTAQQISALLGRPVNLYSLDDNIHAGVFWLAHLVAQYRGNEQLAAAAYYQGSTSLASHGLYQDTVRYVSNAMRLKSRYGG